MAQPTVFVAGEQEHRCSVCYTTEFEVIPKLKATAKLSPAKKTVKAGKSYTLKISKLAQGDSVKSVTAPKKAKLTIKKVKNNQYRISGKKKGTFKVTVKLQSKAKFTCKVKVK